MYEISPSKKKKGIKRTYEKNLKRFVTFFFSNILKAFILQSLVSFHRRIFFFFCKSFSEKNPNPLLYLQRWNITIQISIFFDHNRTAPFAVSLKALKNYKDFGKKTAGDIVSPLCKNLIIPNLISPCVHLFFIKRKTRTKKSSKLTKKIYI